MITKEKEYTVDEKIPEIEERIASDDFVRCHTSFLVNFSYVKNARERNCCWKMEKQWMSAEATGKDGRCLCGMDEAVGEVETE